MVKTKLALLIDSIIISFLISLTLVLWIKHFTKNAILFYFSLIFAFLLMFMLVFYLLCKKNNKKIFKNNNDKFLQSCLNFLSSTNQKSYSDFICKLISCEKIYKYFFKIENNFLYINLQSSLTDKDFLYAQELFIEHKNKSSKLYFIFKSKEKSFDEIALISNLNFSILQSDIISKLMIKKNIYPISQNEQKDKVPLKQKMKQLIKSKTSGVTKKQFKHIFISGISLLFLSLVTPFSNYYLIIGSILLIISIISLFKKNIETNSDDSEFLFK